MGFLFSSPKPAPQPAPQPEPAPEPAPTPEKKEEPKIRTRGGFTGAPQNTQLSNFPNSRRGQFLA